MSKPVTYYWPACNGNFNEICRAQSVAAGGNLIINGTMASAAQSKTGSPQVMFSGIARDVIFNNNSAVSDFTIIGILNGKPISEIINIPGGGIHSSNLYYNVVTSIVSSAAIDVGGIGMGRTGFTNWFLADYDRIFHQFTAAAHILNNSVNFIYTLECTLEDVSLINNPILYSVPNNTFNYQPFVFDPTGKFPLAGTDSEFGSSQDPFLYARFSCDDSGIDNPGTASARFTMLQQGIR